MPEKALDILVRTQRDAYHAHNAQIEEMSQLTYIPVEAVTKLVEERDYVFAELQKRIDALLV